MTITLEKVEPGIDRIRVSDWRGRAVGYDVSAYLVGGVLVDTGFPGARAGLLSCVSALAPRGGIVTHWHEDHSGNVPALADVGFPLRMHPLCEAILRERPSIGLYRRFVWGWTPPLTSSLTPFDCSPLQMIETPGHSDDHLVVWDAERGIVASGDLFLGVKVRVAHSHESPCALLRSLRAIAALEPRLLLDGHRGPLENATDMLRAKIAWMDDTIGEIQSLAATGAPEREIQRRVIGGESLIGWASRGEYSKRSLVHAVLREDKNTT